MAKGHLDFAVDTTRRGKVGTGMRMGSSAKMRNWKMDTLPLAFSWET